MTKVTVQLITALGIINAGTVLSEKDLSKYFKDDEIKQLKKDKFLVDIHIPDISTSLKTINNEISVELIHIDEMTDEQLTSYAKELGIDLLTYEDVDEIYNAILDFDYSTLRVTPLKKYAQIIGVNLDGKTKKEECIKAIQDFLDNQEIVINEKGFEE